MNFRYYSAPDRRGDSARYDVAIEVRGEILYRIGSLCRTKNELGAGHFWRFDKNVPDAPLIQTAETLAEIKTTLETAAANLVANLFGGVDFDDDTE